MSDAHSERARNIDEGERDRERWEADAERHGKVLEEKDPVRHTPGPWTCERFETDGHRYCQRTVVSNADFGTVAELNYSDSGYLGDPKADARKATQLANARLIAAAPDLLAACKAVLACPVKHDENGHAYLAVPARSLNDLGAQIRAIVNAAEGRTA